MPSLNVDLNYFGHPKTKALRRLLGKGSEVLPLKVWVYTALYFAKDGRLTNIPAAELEAECQWWGKPGEMVRRMVEVTFLEMDGKTIVVHDWLEHESHIISFHERAKKGGEAAKAARDRAKAEQNESASSTASSTPLTEQTDSTNRQTDSGPSGGVAENGKKPRPPPGVVGSPGDDDLDDEIRRYIAAHTMLTYHAKAHSDLRKTVLSVGWNDAKRYVEDGIRKGKSFPIAHAAGCVNNVEKASAATPRPQIARRVREDD